jgi:hypothetical protein
LPDQSEHNLLSLVRLMQHRISQDIPQIILDGRVDRGRGVRIAGERTQGQEGNTNKIKGKADLEFFSSIMFCFTCSNKINIVWQ